MRLCTSCGEKNIEGVLFCEECGQPLITRVAGPYTQSFTTGELNLDFAPAKPSWGTAHFATNNWIVFHITGIKDPVVLEPREEMLLGRADASSKATPALDFTPYGAQEMGISRQHATIRRMDGTLTITDLNSVNGTLLNGQRLAPNQPRVLRDGDEIRLGKLVCHVYFK